MDHDMDHNHNTAVDTTLGPDHDTDNNMVDMAHDMAHIIAPLVLSYVDPDVLLAFAQTSLFMRDACYLEWQNRSIRDIEHLDLPLPTHDNRVSRTTAKKLLRLTDRDLELLPRVHAVHPVYKNRITFHEPESAFILACLKHRGPHRVTNKKTNNSTRTKRETMWAKHSSEFGTLSMIEHIKCVEPFLKNGVGGVRAVKARIGRYRATPPDRRVPNDIYDAYLAGNLTVDNLTAVRDRASSLTQALEAHGLRLRSDSRLCDAYIRNGRGSFKNIVDTMLEMQYLHTQTNYRDVFHNLLRTHIRQTYGWLPPHEYQHVVEHVRDDISARAKTIVLRRHPRPDPRPVVS